MRQAMVKNDGDFIDILEAAKVTGYSVHTIRKYVQQRRIPFYQRKPGAPLRFVRAELEEWSEPKKVDPKAEAVS